ncbi:MULTISPECIES: transposase [unclassified Candidatus Frackibacter]
MNLKVNFISLHLLHWESAFWSRSYCVVSTGGATIETIKESIENQGKK